MPMTDRPDIPEEAVEAAFNAGVKPWRPRAEREDHRRTVWEMLEAAAPALRKQGAEERDRELAARADDLPPAIEEVLAALSDVDRQAARVVFLAAFNLQIEDVAEIAWAKGAEEERVRLRGEERRLAAFERLTGGNFFSFTAPEHQEEHVWQIVDAVLDAALDTPAPSEDSNG